LNEYFCRDRILIEAMGSKPSFDFGSGLAIVTPAERILFRMREAVCSKAAGMAAQSMRYKTCSIALCR
jgi:hypothetical protein